MTKPSYISDPPPFVPKSERRSKLITCRRCARDVVLADGECEHCGWVVAEATDAERLDRRAARSVLDMTTPANKPTPKPAARKRASKTVETPAVETPKPARKRASKSSAKLEVVPEPKPATPKISDDQRRELIARNESMLVALEVFESYVIELIEAGVSPTTIGNVIERGNSSIRRIAMRRSPGLVK